MSNVLDYIAWRGDLSFDASPFNEIDVLVLCQITYLRFDGILGLENFKSSLTMRELSDVFQKTPDFESRSSVGVLINRGTVDVLIAAAKSERFANVRITGFVNVVDLAKEEQFAAVTYILSPKKSVVIFRGTDDNIVGFKEDFNLCILDEVPAQKDAVRYLERAAREVKGRLVVGGHSKGGNLSVYASAMCSPSVKRRISAIYNLDGPGFQEKKIHSQEFYEVIPKLHSYYPHFSIVGMFFTRAGKYSVVDSDQTGILQHDPLSWHVMGNGFELMEDFDGASAFFSKTLNAWLMGVSREQQVQFIETLFNVLESTDAKTNSEMEKNILKNFFVILRAWNETPPEIRRNVEATVLELFKAAHRQIPSISELFEKLRRHSQKSLDDCYAPVGRGSAGSPGVPKRVE